MSDEIKNEPLYALVRYRLKPEHIERSRLRAAELYAELAAMGRRGCGRRASRWTTTAASSPSSSLTATRAHCERSSRSNAIGAGLAERCQEPPTTTTMRLLGAYRQACLERIVVREVHNTT
jgi:hypothetical protein